MRKLHRDKVESHIHHNQTIHYAHWSQQKLEVLTHFAGAKNWAASLGLDLEDFLRLKRGEILVSTLHGYPVGIAKDNHDCFRIISFPDYLLSMAK